MCSSFPSFCFFRVSFWKINLFASSWDGSLAFKKVRGPIWRPEDQFGGIWWWSEYTSKKHEHRLPPCHVLVRPNPAKVRGNRFVWSMPCPDTPRPPKYNLKFAKHMFLWKLRFYRVSAILFCFAPYGDSGRFDVTGWSGNILRIEMDPGSPIFCLTE